MDFFFHQTENLSTINVIIGKMLGPLPATLWFGLVFIVIVIVGLLLQKRFAWRLSSVLIFSLAIAWLPLCSQFVYSAAREFNDTWFVLQIPESEQRIWRYCRIDQFQNLRGGLCGLDSFNAQIEKIVPRGASIAFFDSIFYPYLNYFNYGSYTISNPTEADFVIAYRSPHNTFVYIDNQLYKIENNEKKLLGNFSVSAAFAPDQIIFKRQ